MPRITTRRVYQARLIDAFGSLDSPASVGRPAVGSGSVRRSTSRGDTAMRILVDDGDIAVRQLARAVFCWDSGFVKTPRPGALLEQLYGMVDHVA